MDTLYIGGKFPAEVPLGTEGASLEVIGGKKMFLVHTPEATQEEIDAFNSGVDQIGVYLHKSRVPVMLMIVKFKDKKFTPVEGSMNTKLLSNQDLQDNFYKVDGGYNNILLMFLLDNQIIKGMGTLGLSEEIMDALNEGAQKQQKASYNKQDYFREMQLIWNMHSTDELLKAAKAVQRF